MTHLRLAPLAFALLLPAAAFGQSMPGMTGGTMDAAGMAQMQARMMAQGGVDASTLQQGGQAAFDAIQEIVTQLAADPKIDWCSATIRMRRALRRQGFRGNRAIG
jgi:hypothetical protein